MKFFSSERSRRLLRTVATPIALIASIWHATHVYATWRQSQQYTTTDPALSKYFWSACQGEIGVTVAALFAAIFAWQLGRMKPRVVAEPS